MDIKILVTVHKKCWLPKDPVYWPIHVGAEGKSPLEMGGVHLSDDTGDSISDKNPCYCELTGIYWAWKNLKADYIGLCHYRRYFSCRDYQHQDIETVKRQILKGTDYEKLLGECDVILPQRMIFEDTETVESNYADCHHKKDLQTLRQVISEMHPDYLNAFDTVMERHHLHCYNMFVMKKEIFNRYCQWIFSVLFEVEKRVDISEYDPYQARIFGFLAERLMDVWLSHQNLRTKEVPIAFLRDKLSVGRQIQAFFNRIRYGISDSLSNH